MSSQVGQWGSLKEAMEADKAAAKRARVDPIAAMAERCGVSCSQVYKWIEEQRGIPAAQVATWAEVTGSECAQRYLIAQWGFDVVYTRDAEFTTHDLEMQSLPTTISECADVFRATADALRDNHVDRDEAQRITRECIEAIEALQQLRHDVEASLPSADSRVTSLAEAGRISA